MRCVVWLGENGKKRYGRVVCNEPGAWLTAQSIITLEKHQVRKADAVTISEGDLNDYRLRALKAAREKSYSAGGKLVPGALLRVDVADASAYYIVDSVSADRVKTLWRGYIGGTMLSHRLGYVRLLPRKQALYLVLKEYQAELRRRGEAV